MELLLDSGIRAWCTVPIFVLVLLCAFLRQNILLILRTDPKTDLKDVRYGQVLARARLLQPPIGTLLSPKAFLTRLLYFTKRDGGILCNPPTQPGVMQALMQANQDPSAMFGMMKNNFAFLILNGGLAYIVSFLFSGFLVARVPFPLTYRFKSMLQRGIDLGGLDVTYVSSLSWYFLVLFGCNGILTVVNTMLGQESEVGDLNSATMMMSGMAMGMGGPPQQQQGAGGGSPPGMPGLGGPDMAKLFTQAKNEIEVVKYTFALVDVEEKLLAKWEDTKAKDAATSVPSK